MSLGSRAGLADAQNPHGCVNIGGTRALAEQAGTSLAPLVTESSKPVKQPPGES